MTSRTAVQTGTPAYPSAILSPFGSVPMRTNEVKWETTTMPPKKKTRIEFIVAGEGHILHREVPYLDATRRPKSPKRGARKSKGRKAHRG